ncbi:MAG: DNA polymerase III subunit gamma/tau [Burkholderiaceae bacterium]
MSHQVLARKWRPRDFSTLVGQPHVVRALSHALTTGRLHHAYLFTGTRGVGKTTLARILAKAVNCETGVSAQPCGRCSACLGIDAGRFADVIELDAASNRGVDEMAQLLENAVYAPVMGRYKVYVIDEVHMLTHHAFNAMLKTLEEPPAHLLFVLATTDPQKVPVTVLSRCMQFNLRNVAAPEIAAHLTNVLAAEGVAAEAGALELLGRQARGSVRDALSLTDQAIAYGAGSLTAEAVRDMLGLLDGRHVERILDALAAEAPGELVALADEIAAENLSADGLLAELAERLSLLAVSDALGQEGALADPQLAAVERWRGRFDALDLQVYYQIAIHARRDIALAPDARAGLVMALLRLTAFKPEPEPDVGLTAAANGRSASAEPPSRTSRAHIEGGQESGQAMPRSPVRAAPPRVAVAPAATHDTQPARPRPGPLPSEAAAPLDQAQADPGSGAGGASAALRAIRAARQRQQGARPGGGSSDLEEPEGVRATPRGPRSPVTSAAGRAAAAGLAGGGHDADRGVDAPPWDRGPPEPPDDPSFEPPAEDGESTAAFDDAPQRRASGATTRSAAHGRDGLAPPASGAGFSGARAGGADRAVEPGPPAAAGGPEAECTPDWQSATIRGAPAGFDGDWPGLADTLSLNGRDGEFMRQSQLLAWDGDRIQVRVPITALADDRLLARVVGELRERLGAANLTLQAEVGRITGETAALRADLRRRAREQRAREAIEADPFVRSVLDDLGASIVPESIRPIDEPSIAQGDDNA